MKRLLVSLLVTSLLFLSPAAESATKRSDRHSHKTASTKVVKAKKAQRVKAKRKQVISAKAGKKLRTNKASVQLRVAKRIKARSHEADQRRAETPIRQAAAVSTLQLDYGDALTDGELELRSVAALVVDQKTGEALYAKNPNVETPIASITKLMTALVTLETGLSLDDKITIGLQDVDHIKGTGSRLPLGATLTRRELLNLALIASENRAAAALSRSYPGGREAFVQAMNRRAGQLEMRNTHYVDGTGLSSSNRSTAADLARLVDAAYRLPMIRQITSTGSYDVTVPGYRMVKVRENGKTRRVSRSVERNVAFVNTNALTRHGDWDIGVSKTGFINEAGHCLVMQAKIAERRVIIVLLDSLGKMSRIGDANRIRKWLENGYGGQFAARNIPQV